MKERGVMDDESGKWMMKGRLSWLMLAFERTLKQHLV